MRAPVSIEVNDNGSTPRAFRETKSDRCSLLTRARLRLARGTVNPAFVYRAGIIQGTRLGAIQGNSIDLTVAEVYQIRAGSDVESRRKENARL